MHSETTIKKFTTTEPAYQASLELRNRLLRIPLGMNVFDDDLSDEPNQTHFGLFEGERLLGCVILKDLGDGVAKLRQMAVDENRQGQGLGRQLLQGMETLARTAGIEKIEMAARLTAKNFYEKLGYHSEGNIFQQVGINHIKMTKRL